MLKNIIEQAGHQMNKDGESMESVINEWFKHVENAREDIVYKGWIEVDLDKTNNMLNVYIKPPITEITVTYTFNKD